MGGGVGLGIGSPSACASCSTKSSTSQACSAKTGDGLEAGMQKLMAQKAKTAM